MGPTLGRFIITVEDIRFIMLVLDGIDTNKNNNSGSGGIHGEHLHSV